LSSGTYYLRARYYDPATSRMLSEDSYWGKSNDPLSLNLYAYCSNNPIMFCDPSGHMPVKELRSLFSLYCIGELNKDDIAPAVLSSNGWNIYTGFHEVAQIVAGARAGGSNVVLEYQIKSVNNGVPVTYEADIVKISAPYKNSVWEVKPLNGQDPKPQLELYTKNGELNLGRTYTDIKDIKIISVSNYTLYMGIKFPNKGEVNYYFYTIDESGKVKDITTAAAKNIYQKYLMDKAMEEMPKFTPIPMPIPAPVPIPIPAI